MAAAGLGALYMHVCAHAGAAACNSACPLLQPLPQTTSVHPLVAVLQVVQTTPDCNATTPLLPSPSSELQLLLRGTPGSATAGIFLIVRELGLLSGTAVHQCHCGLSSHTQMHPPAPAHQPNLPAAPRRPCALPASRRALSTACRRPRPRPRSTLSRSRWRSRPRAPTLMRTATCCPAPSCPPACRVTTR